MSDSKARLARENAELQDRLNEMYLLVRRIVDEVNNERDAPAGTWPFQTPAPWPWSSWH